MNIKSNVLIVSVFQKGVNQNTNVDNHIHTMEWLRMAKVPHLELQGRYEGVDELSILIEGFDNRSLVETLAKKFNQECYLESHNDRATFLVFPDGSRTSIGTLTPVSETEAKAVGNYSYNPVVGQYFITK